MTPLGLNAHGHIATDDVQATAARMLSQHGYAKAYQRAGEYALDAKYAKPPRPNKQSHWDAVCLELTHRQIGRN